MLVVMSLDKTDAPPVACTLNASDLSARVAEISAIGAEALLQTHVAGRHATLRFAPHRDTLARLSAVVAAEAECCAFLTMDLVENATGLVLSIEAPEGAELVVGELAAAFGASEPQVYR